MISSKVDCKYHVSCPYQVRRLTSPVKLSVVACGAGWQGVRHSNHDTDTKHVHIPVTTEVKHVDELLTFPSFFTLRVSSDSALHHDEVITCHSWNSSGALCVRG